jgi:hypothetical protein
MREEKEEHVVLPSVLLIIGGGGRSGGQCQQLHLKRNTLALFWLQNKYSKFQNIRVDQ